MLHSIDDYIEAGLVHVPSQVERFKKYVEYKDGHWLWVGHKNHDGYGRFQITEFGMSKLWLSHVWAYTTFVGRVPEGLELGHIPECKFRNCVNPTHMRPVTHLQNMRDGTDPRIDTHCPNGHAWAENDNLFIRLNGQRQCRTCNRERSREAMRRKREREKIAANDR